MYYVSAQGVGDRIKGTLLLLLKPLVILWLGTADADFKTPPPPSPANRDKLYISFFPLFFKQVYQGLIHCSCHTSPMSEDDK